MALIAYLMEFKGNNGPHLIIVPNAVLVNWKVKLFSAVCCYFSLQIHLLCDFHADLIFISQSELYNWLPSVSCIFYVGGKDERSKLFSQVSDTWFIMNM